MSGRGLLIVLSAPSGAGKTTLCEALLKLDRRLARSISVTTRDPRGGEREGRDYYFADDAEFRRQIRERGFLEWAEVHGHRYGTLKSEVERKRRMGRDVILVIDVQGGLAVKRRDSRAVLIFVQPPSFKTLEARLRGRGTDEPRVIRERLRHARWEMAQAFHYDYVLVNAELSAAVEQVRAIITAERLRTLRSQRRARLKK